MSDLLSGTVTFLFTDIEGSTKLLHELGAERYAEQLARHRHVLREAFSRHEGVEVDTQGDAFFVAFPTAPGAVEAAREAQEALELPVRMGLHTGTPLLTEEGYVGHDVHKAARIAAAGHGRQILVSASTQALLEPSNSLLLDLGEHRLKDLSAPERIYQAGEGDFPPLKTLYQTNLPVPATPFLGRESELGDILGLLASNRLMTLTGPGGTGKTRLALQASAEAADRFPDGVFWVPLASVEDPDLVLGTVGRTIGARNGLAKHVAGRSLLLLLDNFEHVVAAAPDLSALMSGCPNLRVLVTSRELLGVPGEQAYPVAPLRRADGRELFIARARAAKPDFEPGDSLDELCDRLDNLPLALELAAARVRMLSPAQLLERLSDRLDLLRAGRGADPRQQTLRATIEWSHDLLDEEEQRLFARLAVFRGGCKLEAAEQVCGAGLDTLQSLVDKSLVGVRDEGRFWMLETIHEYALERLEASGEAEELRRRHAEHFFELVESASLAIEAAGRAPQRHELVLPEQDNVRAALDWAGGVDPALALEAMCALEGFWTTHDPSEGKRRFADLLDRAAGLELPLRARAIRDYGGTLDLLGEIEDAERRYRESLAIFEQLEDRSGVLHMRLRLGVVAAEKGETDRATTVWEEVRADAHEAGEPMVEVAAIGNLGYTESRKGNFTAAVELAREAVGLARDFGLTWIELINLNNLAEVSAAAGRVDDARRSAQEALALGLRIADRMNIVAALATRSLVARLDGDLFEAGRLWGAVQAEVERRPIGRWQDSVDETGAKVVGDEPKFERGVEAGRALSLDEAAREAAATGLD